MDEVNRVVPQLIKNGKVERPGLGVQVAHDQLAKELGVRKGAVIVRAFRNGPAAKAGLRPTRRDSSGDIRLGDIIVAVEDKPVEKANDLFDVLETYKIGDTVTLTILARRRADEGESDARLRGLTTAFTTRFSTGYNRFTLSGDSWTSKPSGERRGHDRSDSSIPG